MLVAVLHQGNSRPLIESMSPDRPTFSSRLVVPASWEVMAQVPSAETLAALEQSNGAILDTLVRGIDLAAARRVDERLAEALMPLALKLDLVLEMLGRLSYRDFALPAPHAIDISLSKISWSQPKAVPVGEWMLVRLYFHQAFREPVSLCAQVARCDAGAANEGYRVQADLAEMSEGVGEAFARLVFLEHRHQLALHPARAGAR